MNGYAVANGLYSANQGNHHKRRQEPPELYARGQVESRPGAQRRAYPGRIQYLLRVVQTEGRCHCATHRYAYKRRPQPQRRRGAQYKSRDGGKGGERHYRGSRL